MIDSDQAATDPAPGDARKEVLFTRKGGTLYAILPRYATGSLILRDLRLARGARVSLLGSRYTEVGWRQSARDVVLAVPVIADGELPFDGPRVFRIEGAMLP